MTFASILEEASSYLFRINEEFLITNTLSHHIVLYSIYHLLTCRTGKTEGTEVKCGVSNLSVVEYWLMAVKSTLIFLSDFMGRRKRIILTVVYFGLFQINVFK